MILRNLDENTQCCFTKNHQFTDWLLNGADGAIDSFEHHKFESGLLSEGFMTNDDERNIIITTFEGGASIVAAADSIILFYDNYLESLMIE